MSKYEFEDEEEDEEKYCTACNGTGISPSGKVDSSCSACRGTGVLHESEERDYDPDDFDYPEPDQWEP